MTSPPTTTTTAHIHHTEKEQKLESFGRDSFLFLHVQMSPRPSLTIRTQQPNRMTIERYKCLHCRPQQALVSEALMTAMPSVQPRTDRAKGTLDIGTQNLPLACRTLPETGAGFRPSMASRGPPSRINLLPEKGTLGAEQKPLISSSFVSFWAKLGPNVCHCDLTFYRLRKKKT